MPRYLAALAILLMIAMVAARLLLMKRRGIAALKFGEIDKTDFLIPPFALFYIYLVFAGALGLPAPGTQQLIHSSIAAWAGAALCLAGVLLMLWSLVSFGASFRVGIDTRQPGSLITEGVFAYCRNPIYTAFAFILLGELLIFSGWIFLVYAVAGFCLFHRQVLREEKYLRQQYGEQYAQYARRVRRYL